MSSGGFDLLAGLPPTPDGGVYLDNNATTAVAPEVIEAMLPYLTEHFGNPSSMHRYGAAAGEGLATAREQVAALLGVRRPSEIIFTAGGSESDNLAIVGTLRAYKDKKHVVTSAVEHPAVIGLCRDLEARQGYEVDYVKVDAQGRLDIDQLRAVIRDDTAVVSIMMANNETGVLFASEEIAPIVKEKGAVFHVDAVQAAGKLPLDMSTSGIDMLSISGHKLHAPKGVGALYVRKGTKLRPLIVGGHQERGRRAGTENVASCVAVLPASLPAAIWPTRTRGCAPCGTVSKTTSWRLCPTATATAIRITACPTPATSASPTSRAKASCYCSAAPVSLRAAVRPAPAAASNRATC